MSSSFAVCWLAVVLCLVVCVCANAKVTLGEATKEVGAAKEAVKTVCARAQTQFDNANRLLDKVESSKDEVNEAASKALTTAKDNTEAEAIANTIKSLSDEVDKLYATEKQKLDDAVKRLKVLLSEAETLNGKTDIKIELDTDSTDDYTVTNGKAAALKLEAAELDGNITEASALFTGVESTANTMEKKSKKAQIKDFQVNVVVFVAKIKSMLENADDIIPQIEEKEREVSGIVKQMQKDCTTELTQSNEVFKRQCQIANDALKSVQGAVGNLKRAKADIQTQKDTADAALTKLKEENQEVSEAKGEVQQAEACVEAAEQIVPKLYDALQIAKDSVITATDSKEKLKTALSTTTSAPSTVQATETAKANPPVGQVTEPDQKDTTIQPTSKELPSQSNNSSEQLKDTLINGAQNVPTTALTGEKAPAPGAKNDSAMTVSVPLLVALIASAVWQ